MTRAERASSDRVIFQDIVRQLYLCLAGETGEQKSPPLFVEHLKFICADLETKVGHCGKTGRAVKEALLHYLSHPAEAIAELINPAPTISKLLDRAVGRFERFADAPVYTPNERWEECLHQWIGVRWPCAELAEFAELWPVVMHCLANKGLKLGPESFYGWNDGDPELVRAIWCLVRHLKPEVVVETGVGHGVTSRFILEAMERNGKGRLWSIDLFPVTPEKAAEIGIAVEDRFQARWTLINGSSRRHLPALARELRQIDLFIHDSLHSARNVCFELSAVRPAMLGGSFCVVDDIDTNQGFARFGMTWPEARQLVCQSKPLRPDERRFDGNGLFGIIRK